MRAHTLPLSSKGNLEAATVRANAKGYFGNALLRHRPVLLGFDHITPSGQQSRIKRFAVSTFFLKSTVILEAPVGNLEAVQPQASIADGVLSD